MKNLILLAAAMFPFTAFAAPVQLECSSSPVSFTITAPQGLLLGAKLHITAHGVFETELDAQVDMVESVLAPRLVVDITTLDAQGKIDLTSSIPARLELGVKEASDNSLVSDGTGIIQITRIPSQHPRRMLSHYELSRCEGTL